MTAQQIINQADKLHLAQVDADLQLQWLQDLQLQVWQEVLSKCENAPQKPQADTDLLIEDPYTDVYVYYLLRQGALQFGDVEQYNQYQALFSSRYREFAAWYLRSHRVLS